MTHHIQIIHKHIQKHYLILQKEWRIVVRTHHTTKQDRGTQ